MKNNRRTQNPAPVGKPELARMLAEANDTSAADAADQLDGLIFAVLKRIKQGKPAAFPGLGRIPAAAPAKPARKGAK